MCYTNIRKGGNKMIYDYETNTGGTRPAKRRLRIVSWFIRNWGMILVYLIIIGLAFLFDRR